MGFKLQDLVPNTNALDCCNLTGIEIYIVRAQLRQCGHEVCIFDIEYWRPSLTENCSLELILGADQENITKILSRPMSSLPTLTSTPGSSKPMTKSDGASSGISDWKILKDHGLLQWRRDMWGVKLKAAHIPLQLSSSVVLVDRAAGLKLVFGLISGLTISGYSSSNLIGDSITYTFNIYLSKPIFWLDHGGWWVLLLSFSTVKITCKRQVTGYFTPHL